MRGILGRDDGLDYLRCFSGNVLLTQADDATETYVHGSPDGALCSATRDSVLVPYLPTQMNIRQRVSAR